MSSSSQKKQASSSNMSSSMLLSRLGKGKGLLEDSNRFDMHYPREIYRNIGQQQQPGSFFPVMEKPRLAPVGPLASRGFQPMSLIPKQNGFGGKVGSWLPKLSDLSDVETEPKKKAQITIFYNGEVVVLDDYSAEKAKAVILMAENLSKMGRVAAPPAKKKTNTAKLFGAPFPSNSSATVSVPKFGSNQSVVRQPETFAPTPARPAMTNIPMQRKASLQRFLEKRKDRMSNVAPYQTVNHGKAAAAADDFKSWLDVTDLRSL